MTFFITPDRSFLNLLQQQVPPLRPTPMQWSSLDGLIEGILQFLIKHRLNATLWSHLPSTSRAGNAINAYDRTGLADRIYRCGGINAASSPARVSQSPSEGEAIASKIVPLVFDPLSSLNQEYFFLVLSLSVSLFLWVQESEEPATADRKLPTSARLPISVVHSFSPVLIEALLTRIQQSRIVTDGKPTDRLSNPGLNFPLPTAIDVNLLPDFLQLPWPSFNRKDLSSPPVPSVDSAPDLGIVLTPDFLKQLTQELSLPLTHIKTALRLLDSTQQKREQRQRYLTLLQEQCDRQSFLLSALQELVQLNAVTADSKFSLNLEEWVPGIVSTYQPIAAEKGISLGYTIPPGLPSVTCYSPWLWQILRHLLQNSLKFTPAKGRIQVQIDRRQEAIVLAVTDTGVGIEHKDIPHVFEPFFRARNLPAGETEGSGLGLMVVKQLIERCHGTIKVSSQPRKGTRMVVTLPIVQ